MNARSDRVRSRGPPRAGSDQRMAFRDEGRVVVQHVEENLGAEGRRPPRPTALLNVPPMKGRQESEHALEDGLVGERRPASCRSGACRRCRASGSGGRRSWAHRRRDAASSSSRSNSIDSMTSMASLRALTVVPGLPLWPAMPERPDLEPDGARAPDGRPGARSARRTTPPSALARF